MIKSRKHSHLFSSRRVQKGELEGGESRGMADRRGMSLLAFDPSACGVVYCPGRCLLWRPSHGGHVNHLFQGVYTKTVCGGTAAPEFDPSLTRATGEQQRTTAYHRVPPWTGRAAVAADQCGMGGGGGDAAAADQGGEQQRQRKPKGVCVVFL